jgi:hypothetical protein
MYSSLKGAIIAQPATDVYSTWTTIAHGSTIVSAFGIESILCFS